ncbi:cobyric acid synthase [Dethiobacter alkaliphilus]|uniref:Cobyric acid synthase n=1 Tax=Dethiobacter alkaliphilus AHT 1 TaxID=555088 RepID=C0GDX5_DETAL|nr:cobyric acid synthase [Dethiobacter alkaliphilus]EEG78269.1 cobyric acid synthase CobQ [Dethiobacter alkaliphilus AHT 1]
MQRKAKAKTIMIQGSASHVGKSALATALCRIFAQDGYRVAPFKSWNMALNSYVTCDGGEIGRAQGEQAEAAGIEATVDMNPILVKPKGQGQAQIIVRGRPHGDVSYAARSQEDYIRFSLQVIARSLDTLRDEYDIIVLEGAGSPAEINLADQDVANMKAAKLAEAPVLLVNDIDRGGALAAAVGTMLLLPQEDQQRIAGFIFNKFRGDKAVLEPGLKVVEERTGRPVLGVVPHIQTNLAEEDGVALERSAYCGESQGKLQICVVRLPHISNFTDFDALAAEEDVELIYVDEPEKLSGADAVILPGTKNSMRDLQFLRQHGLDSAILAACEQKIPVVGICGGYQMLGEKLWDPHGGESGSGAAEATGLGLLAVTTRFYPEKKVVRAEGESRLSFALGEKVSGYEIHMGQSEREPGCSAAFTLSGEGGNDGAVSACGRIWGTYLHGVFDRPGFRRAWLNRLRQSRGWQELGTEALDHRESSFDKLAAEVRRALDMDAIYQLLELPGKKKEDLS